MNTAHEEFKLILEIIKTVAIIIGPLLVAFQLRKHIDANTKTHDWNRRKATQDACKEFLDPKLYDHWSNIQEPVVTSKKKYKDLTKDEQQSIRKLLSFLENMGILIRHEIVERHIIYDHFRGIWPIVYDCSEDFIREYRTLRSDDHVFEHFESTCFEFRKIDDELKERGKLPPLPKLKG